MIFMFLIEYLTKPNEAYNWPPPLYHWLEQTGQLYELLHGYWIIISIFIKVINMHAFIMYLHPYLVFESMILYEAITDHI